MDVAKGSMVAQRVELFLLSKKVAKLNPNQDTSV